MRYPKLMMRAVGVTTDRICKSPSNGVSCQFLKLDDTWGVKCYRYSYHRDRAYKHQRLAAKHGLGPKVGPRFKYANYFCYITEVVEVIWDFEAAEKLSDVVNSSNYWHSERDTEFDKLDAEYSNSIYELTDKMKKIGLNFRDNHAANVGIKNGELVCIDFGED